MMEDTYISIRTPLVDPTIPKFNNGFDNSEHDLIVCKNDIIAINSDIQFSVIGLLGSGKFGSVYHVINLVDQCQYALKINKSSIELAGTILNEVKTLMNLSQNGNERSLGNVVGYFGHFVYRGHICIILEKLSFSLYQVLQIRKFTGMPLCYVKIILQDLTNALACFDELDLIHLDIKPENVLMETPSSVHVKLADVGGAKHISECENKCSYAITRYYRPPEIVLRTGMSKKSDIWSLACLIAEMYLGTPLFFVSNELQLLRLIEKRLDLKIPENLIEISPKKEKFYDLNDDLLSLAEFCYQENLDIPIEHNLFKYDKLDDIIRNYPLPPNLSPENRAKEIDNKEKFLDLLKKMLNPDPKLRFSLQDVCNHPFLTSI
ncbi:CMGC family protein kinase [Tritrichomonas foetus]|uniref:CMGC family protein kinase n=1 Tax=Tritrichomonas foetus TaxID=1144522 RepID=A0A1J4KV35_9EUKA|nr:CMGC family protein kinase [Tritrichomonas foetus]|eukprot:OHT15095.1 CMGC family protein kinase [Tritrichomonas foetus]